jgi:hypothetical protein
VLELPPVSNMHHFYSWDTGRSPWPDASECRALQSLQRLYLASRVMSVSFAQALQPLTALTYLNAHLQPAGGQFLPTSLVELCLTTKQQVPQGTVLQLGHLTKLTSLRWTSKPWGRGRRWYNSYSYRQKVTLKTKRGRRGSSRLLLPSCCQLCCHLG